MGNFVNAPMCVDCWNSKNPTRLAIRHNGSERELCCWCNQVTRDGIYVRADNRTLTFPVKGELPGLVVFKDSRICPTCFVDYYNDEDLADHLANPHISCYQESYPDDN